MAVVIMYINIIFIIVFDHGEDLIIQVENLLIIIILYVFHYFPSSSRVVVGKIKLF